MIRKAAEKNICNQLIACNAKPFFLYLNMPLNGEIIGNIMYTKGKLIDKGGNEKPCLSFGPFSIAPKHQRKSYGKMPIYHSFKVSEEMFGFRTSSDY